MAKTTSGTFSTQHKWHNLMHPIFTYYKSTKPNSIRYLQQKVKHKILYTRLNIYIYLDIYSEYRFQYVCIISIPNHHYRLSVTVQLTILSLPLQPEFLPSIQLLYVFSSSSVVSCSLFFLIIINIILYTQLFQWQTLELLKRMRVVVVDGILQDLYKTQSQGLRSVEFQQT